MKMKEKTASLIICMLLIVSIIFGTVIANIQLTDPPDWPTEGAVGEEYTFCIEIPDEPDAEPFYVKWDWGDGNISEWLGPYNSSETACASHTWTKTGCYTIIVKLKDVYGNEEWSDPWEIYIGLSPSNPPSGPTEGSAGEEYTFCIEIPEVFPGDDIGVLWNWGDGTDSGWLGLYTPGDTACASHMWTAAGIYHIKVKLRNEYGYESIWSDSLTIQIYAAHLEIGDITGGIGQVCAEIKNIGEGNATNVNWSIKIMGRFPPILIECSGVIPNIPPGEQEIICTDGLLFGLGRIWITVTVETAYTEPVEKEANGFIFFIFVIIR